MSFPPLDPVVSREEAVQALTKRRPWLAGRLRELRLELVHLPVYILEARLSSRRARRTGQELGSQNVASVFVAVDGLMGQVQRLSRDLPEVVMAGAVDRGSTAPPALDRAQAERRAREEIPWLALMFALRSRQHYTLKDLAVRRGIGYPYWVQHVERRQRRDVRALDGISGKVLGARGRRLIVEAFLGMAREGSSPRSLPSSAEAARPYSGA